MTAKRSHCPGMNVNDAHPVRFRVSGQHLPPITVTATDWMSALGAALHRIDRIGSIRRMACEQIGSGDVIVNDLTNRRRYVVRPLPSVLEDSLEDEVTEVHHRSRALHL